MKKKFIFAVLVMLALGNTLFAEKIYKPAKEVIQFEIVNPETTTKKIFITMYETAWYYENKKEIFNQIHKYLDVFYVEPGETKLVEIDMSKERLMDSFIRVGWESYNDNEYLGFNSGGYVSGVYYLVGKKRTIVLGKNAYDVEL